MNLSEEMKSLYKRLQPLSTESSEKNNVIVKALNCEKNKKLLEIRLRIVKVVGLIKFFNSLPIYVPNVEENILNEIKSGAIANHLNPVLTTSFFKVIMEHSKIVQAQLLILLKDKPVAAQQILNDSISALKNDFPDENKIIDNLSDSKTSAIVKLTCCRQLIQNTNNAVLKNMISVSDGFKMAKL